jgi:hypothetical protein
MLKNHSNINTMEKINLITTREDFANLITELALEISAKQNFKWISEAVAKKIA